MTVKEHALHLRCAQTVCNSHTQVYLSCESCLCGDFSELLRGAAHPAVPGAMRVAVGGTK